jgi:type IV secretion system protein TrbB
MTPSDVRATHGELAVVSTGESIPSKLRTATRAILPYLEEARVIEIMLNPDGWVWVDRAGQGMSRTDTMISYNEAEGFLRFVATESGATLTRDTPTLAGTLPHWGARVQGWIPPVVARPSFTIRKRPPVIYGLDDYVSKQVITSEQRDALVRAILDHQNILVGGGTGTGKTTFTNALLRVIAERTRDRLYIAEDNPELQCAAPNVIPVLTERGKYTMRDAVFDALRARPDRIIVGELRDGTALDLLKAWNTGHRGGLATIHANDTRGMLTRMCQLVEEDCKHADKTVVAETINVCVHLTLDPGAAAGRRLSGLDAVKGYDAAAQCWRLEPIA